MDYNYQGCTIKDCQKLHVCRDQLVLGLNCPNSSCRLEHAFDTAHNRAVLKLKRLHVSPELLMKFYLVNNF